MGSWTKENVLQEADDRGVRFIRLQFTDIFGTLKNVAITNRQLENALDGKIMIDTLWPFGEGRKEERVFLKPDPATFATFPWRPQEGAVARLICDIYDGQGEPSLYCTRSLFKKVLSEAKSSGYTFSIGPESDFFLFLVDDFGRPTVETHDRGGHYDLTPLDKGENARRDMIITLQDMGLEVESSYHETSPGQHCLKLNMVNALSAADNITTYRFVIRTIAQRHGIHATFIPKPGRHLSGSGLRLRFGINTAGESRVEEDRDNYIYFTAGLLNHACALTALSNPIVNSYKRLLYMSENIEGVIWSKNIGPYVRINPNDNKELQLEWLSPDSTCNPYLTLSAAIKAGINGIEKKISSRELTEETSNILEEKAACQVAAQGLPMSLETALTELDKDAYIKAALGESFINNFISGKIEELNDYYREVHNWELEKYLDRY